MEPFSKTNKSILKFIFFYITLIAVFFTSISFVPLQKVFDINNIYSRFITVISAKLINLIGIPAQYNDRFIILPNISLKVVYGCNGIDAAMIYGVAVLAFPAQWKKNYMEYY